MLGFAKELSDQQLLDVVRAMDIVSLPLDRRFEGDDKAITDLMTALNLNQTVVDKLLISREVLRECVSRGLQLPLGN